MPDEFVPKKAPETKPLRVDSAKEPPKEVAEMTFSLKDMPKGTDTAPIQLPPTGKKEGEKNESTNTDGTKPKADESGVVKPAGDGQTKTEPKTEPSSVLKPPAAKSGTEKKVDSEKKDEIRQVAPKDPNAKKERDYTGFSAEEVTHLKAMSNEAFTYTSNLIKQSKELEKLKDASFLQHPDSYKLSPDYSQTVQQIEMAGVEAQAWRTALIECKAGRKFQVPKGINKETGQLVLSEPLEGTEEYEVELSQILTKVSNVQSELQGKLQNMSQTFKARTTQDRQMAQQEMSRRFAWVAKPEMLDWTVTTQTGKDVPIKQIISDFKEVFPPYDRNTVGVEAAANLMVAFIILEGELRNATQGKNTAETKMEEVKRGEPSSEAVERESGVEIGGVKNFSLAGMPR